FRRHPAHHRRHRRGHWRPRRWSGRRRVVAHVQPVGGAVPARPAHLRRAHRHRDRHPAALRREPLLDRPRDGHHLVALPAHRGHEVSAWPPPSPTTTPLIELHHVSKWFGDVVAVSDVTFGIGTGITALLGPNGAGK